MKKRLGRALTAAAVTLAGTAALTGASAIASGSTGTTIKLGRTTLGQILTTSRGMTIYEFSRDRRNSDRCVKIRGCLATWPAVTTKGRPVAGRGVKASLLGTIKLPSGARQVTYNGHPLYTYVGDFGPRQVDYVGFSMFGGTWDALNAAGKVVK
jgi:predicted lipoprotein with Yx(FWY)xxD motif